LGEAIITLLRSDGKVSNSLRGSHPSSESNRVRVVQKGETHSLVKGYRVKGEERKKC